MGMYDEVFTAHPLPDPEGLPSRLLDRFRAEVAAGGYQTKDLECLLDRYLISGEGRLLRYDTGAGAAGWPDRDGAEVDFHGRIELFTVFYADDRGVTSRFGVTVRVIDQFYDGEAYGIHYLLKFTDGVLVAVEKAVARRVFN